MNYTSRVQRRGAWQGTRLRELTSKLAHEIIGASTEQPPGLSLHISSPKLSTFEQPLLSFPREGGAPGQSGPGISNP